MARHAYSLRSLDALQRSLEARDQERDSTMLLLLNRLSGLLVRQQAMLDRIAAEHAQILAALTPPLPATSDLASVDAGGIVVLDHDELCAVLERAA